MQLFVLLVTITILIAANGRLVEVTTSNISDTLDDWEYDLAIMFYAPWCKYCKQLYPSWETIAKLSAHNKDLIVGKYNCELSDVNTKVCSQLKIDRYPSLVYIGYGNFHQASKGGLIGKTESPKIVRYVADLYPEALFDWVNMLSVLSSAQRRYDDFVGFFFGKSRTTKKLEKMKNKLQKVENEKTQLSTKLELYEAKELFDSLEDLGDPFPLLNSMTPDQENAPFRACISEMTAEFCKYYPDEHFCQISKSCAQQDYKPQVCRPAKCPFVETRGCRVTSQCLRKDVITQYQQAMKKTEAKV